MTVETSGARLKNLDSYLSTASVAIWDVREYLSSRQPPGGRASNVVQSVTHGPRRAFWHRRVAYTGEAAPEGRMGGPNHCRNDRRCLWFVRWRIRRPCAVGVPGPAVTATTTVTATATVTSSPNRAGSPSSSPAPFYQGSAGIPSTGMDFDYNPPRPGSGNVSATSLGLESFSSNVFLSHYTGSSSKPNAQECRKWVESHGSYNVGPFPGQGDEFCFLTEQGRTVLFVVTSVNSEPNGYLINGQATVWNAP
jgi:hypothetical protein